MLSEIHIYLYYNVTYGNYTSQIADDYKTYCINTTQLSIITDQNLVKNILINENNQINNYGEFINYDSQYFMKYADDDYNKYKLQTKDNFENHCTFDHHVNSIYYIKCEIVKDISQDLNNFKNKICS